MGSIDQIYQKYFQDIYRFLLSLSHDHYTAEDIVQETFLRAYLYVEFYDNENVKTWLFTVAYRTFIDHYRKQKKSVSKEGTFWHDDDMILHDRKEEKGSFGARLYPKVTVHLHIRKAIMMFYIKRVAEKLLLSFCLLSCYIDNQMTYN
ncbi:sigma-70 family RNA polymerase sigma factor [Gracilibacillus thailandensis]|uniref:sigma-70 family RNA polymerase sigma factor n=1 Tax=Gracilibacillus thailandensis TaxID=563735 RepID=UPI002B4B3C55|nr:sigma-70 family RNA polymerase sigma factor [Gracilibacillus thailandensis]